MATLQDIYHKLDEYLLLPDKNIVKLLCGFYIANRLPVDPPWLFITAGSSTGKTELLKLLELCDGYYALDDLTNNSLLSGMRRSDQSASLLHRLEPNSFLVFSDFTTMLSKNKEELSAILGKLRTVFDGKATRVTGGTELEIKWEGKVGLLAACTTTLYSKTEDYAEVGQRMIIYHLQTADDYAIGRFRFQHRKKDKKAITRALQETVAEYVGGIAIPQTFEALPDFDEQTEQDILDIAHLAVTARSPLQRDRYSRGKPLTGREDKESIGRVQGQLITISYGLMLQNPDQKLTPEDRKLLYKIGLDCIDPRRREILRILTEYSYGGDIDSIAEKMDYPRDTTTIMVEDLVALHMVERIRTPTTFGSKTSYRLKDHYKAIMARFENIQSKTEELQAKEEPVDAWG